MCEKRSLSEKIKNLLLDYCLPYDFIRCVKISAQKAIFFRRSSEKTTFEKNAFLWKMAIFSEKQPKICLFCRFSKFFWFFVVQLIVSTIESNFSTIDIVFVSVWPKKHKKWLNLDPKFPNKSEKHPNFNGPYLANGWLFFHAVCGVETATKNTFI